MILWAYVYCLLCMLLWIWFEKSLFHTRLQSFLPLAMSNLENAYKQLNFVIKRTKSTTLSNEANAINKFFHHRVLLSEPKTSSLCWRGCPPARCLQKLNVEMIMKVVKNSLGLPLLVEFCQSPIFSCSSPHASSVAWILAYLIAMKEYLKIDPIEYEVLDLFIGAIVSALCRQARLPD